MTTWAPITVITAPQNVSFRDDARSYSRLRGDSNDPTSDNAIIDRLAPSIVLQFEKHLNRALFSQRRQANALVEYDQVYSIKLEPFSNVTISTSTDNSTFTEIASSDYFILGREIYFEPMLPGLRRRFLRFEYDAGWDTLPADLYEAILSKIQYEFERKSEVVNDAGEVVVQHGAGRLIPPGARTYRISHDPLPLITNGN